MANFWPRYRSIIVYGTSLALLMLLINWLQLRLVIIDHAMDLYITAIALLFTGLGVWLALKLVKPKVQTVVVEREVEVKVPVHEFVFNELVFTKLGISNRELEVLQLMARGMSNREIADSLFVSENTVKTHSSNLFEKLDVKRRTQAVEQGRKLGLIPMSVRAGTSV